MITLTASICDRQHGLPHNSAEVYGHPASTRTCTRVGDVWVYDIAVDTIATARAEAAVEAFRSQVVAAIEGADLYLCECGHDQLDEHNSFGCYGIDWKVGGNDVRCTCKRTDAEDPARAAAARIVADHPAAPRT